MVRSIVGLGVLCLVGLQTASAQDAKKEARVFEFLKKTCNVGIYKVQIEPTKEHGLTIRQLKDSRDNVKGELHFSQKELGALADDLTALIAQQDGAVRTCMEPYVKTILDAVRGTEATQ